MKRSFIALVFVISSYGFSASIVDNRGKVSQTELNDLYNYQVAYASSGNSITVKLRPYGSKGGGVAPTYGHEGFGSNTYTIELDSKNPNDMIFYQMLLLPWAMTLKLDSAGQLLSVVASRGYGYSAGNDK